MKHLFFISLLILSSIFLKAQSGTFVYDATKDVGITGGDGSGSITSYQWTVQGTPPSNVVFTNSTSPILTATVTKAGDYVFVLTVKDNLGNTATGTITGTAYDRQIIHIDLSKSHIYTQLK